MKKILKPSTCLSPVPVIMVSCGDMENSNIMTVAWTGIINSVSPMVSISVRRNRFSYSIIKQSGEFVLNFVTKNLLNVCDKCGVTCGKDIDKFKANNLTKGESKIVKAPYILESPVNLECKVKDVLEYETHVVFCAEVVNVFADESYLDEKGLLKIPEGELVAYANGKYIETGKVLGTYGFTAKK